MKQKTLIILALFVIAFASCDKDEETTTKEPSKTIFPGVGIEEISLNDTYGDMVNKLGEPETYDTIHSSIGTQIAHYFKYETKGIYLNFYNQSDTLSNDEVPRFIYVKSPYLGVTAENIGIGSNADMITKTYSEVYIHISGSYTLYWCDFDGIDFWVGENGVEYIWIYNPLEQEDDKKVLDSFKETNLF